jgi:predicted nucleotidyltransferase
MELDVRIDHLEIVKAILHQHIPERAVWAFGSRIKSTARKTSDLDLVIIGETPLSFETLAAIRDAFSDSNIPYKVDVLDWVTIPDSFREEILKAHLLLFPEREQY